MINKKILVSVLMIGILAFGLGFGTQAWFTDTATSENNTFTAGTVEITLTGGIADGLDFENMAPGDTVTGALHVSNTGSLPVWFAAYITDVSSTPGGFINQFHVTVTTKSNDYYGHETEIYNGPAADLVGKSNALINGEYPPLPAGRWAGYTIEFTLTTDTGDHWQEATLNGKVTVDAIQYDNISWEDASSILKGN